MPKGYPKSAHTISRIEFFCDDRRVGEALRALVNVAIGAPSVSPVVNVKRKGNGLAAKSSGKLLDAFAQHLIEHKPKQMTTQAMRDFCEAAGRSAISSNYLIKNAIAAKLLKRDPKSPNTAAVWFVLPTPKPKSKSK